MSNHSKEIADAFRKMNLTETEMSIAAILAKKLGLYMIREIELLEHQLRDFRGPLVASAAAYCLLKTCQETTDSMGINLQTMEIEPKD